jgi:dipeptidyl aminopeptidase/acylaminoacyl peptidase
LVAAYREAGRWQLANLDTRTLAVTPLAVPDTDIGGMQAMGDGIVYVGASPGEPAAIVRLHLASGQREVLRSSVAGAPDPGYVSVAESVEFPTGNGDTAYGYFYPPANRDYALPRGERPPLLVLSHGGPSAAATTAWNPRLQFWTSRGFAVLDVDYRGSTGHGRAYREKLNGRWGEADVEDCVAGAHYLASRGLVDANRMVIRGGSAGGFTTLCALTFHRVFRAGACYYGVSDLETLARDTHKFEAHYLDRLIAPYPSAREVYRARSPIHHVDRLNCPVIFFQGLDDKVVPPNQTERMVEALRRNKLPVAYVPFEGEGHGFRRAGSIARALEAELYFYSRVFGFRPAEDLAPVRIDNEPA